MADGSSVPRITFPLSQEELNAARQRAEEEGRSVGDLVREALKRYLDS
ncbi:MAG: ribbon-helix-helix protein, CopG family [Solirubrobacterales bacterium]